MTDDQTFQRIRDYWRGKLHQEERDRLATELLEDQRLYNAFADDQIFAELLADPSVCREFLRENPAKRTWPIWTWRFALVALGVLAMAILTVSWIHSHQARRATVGSLGESIEKSAGERGNALLTFVLAPTTRGGKGNTVRLATTKEVLLESLSKKL